MAVDKEQVMKAIEEAFYADEMFKNFLTDNSASPSPEDVLSAESTDATKLWDIFAEEVRRDLIRNGVEPFDDEDYLLQNINTYATDAATVDKGEQQATTALLGVARCAQQIWSKRLGFNEALKEYKANAENQTPANDDAGTEEADTFQPE